MTIAGRMSAMNSQENTERTEILARRARRLRSQSEFRKMANTYGELTSVEPEASRWWVLLAMALHAIHRDDAAAKALRQAAYLLRHAGETARERSVRALASRMATGEFRGLADRRSHRHAA